NQAGTDTKQTIIIYRKQQLLQPPVVNFVNPAQNPIEIDQPQVTIAATVLNVDKQQNVTVSVNGQELPTQAYSYSKANNMTTFTANLVEGANLISVRGVNEVGMD